MNERLNTGPILTRRAALLHAAALPLTDIPPLRQSLRISAAPLRLLVSGAGGSSNDAEGRAFAAFFERHLPQANLQIVNLPGQSGLEAYRSLADAPADGCTVGWAATPSLPARCIDHLAPDLMGRLTLIGAVEREPIALVAPTGGAADVAAFRNVAASGDPIGTAQAGSPSHLAALHLQEIIGAHLNLVAFPSPAAVRQATLAGNISVALMALGEAIASLREGRIEGIGIAADRPAAAFPQLPPLQAAGLPLIASILRGLVSPTGLPAMQSARLTKTLQDIADDPEFHAHADAHGFEAIFLDGSTWTSRTDTERTNLTQLWSRAPWRETTD